MEPFSTQDGHYLLFNTSNVQPSIPSLQFATRLNAQTLEYSGEIQGAGVNEPGLFSATPTVIRKATCTSSRTEATPRDSRLSTQGDSPPGR